MTWTGDAGTTDWNTANNWSPVGCPVGTDVCVTANATVVDSNVSPSEDSLDVALGATLTIGTCTGTNGLSLTVNGPTTVEGSLVLGPSGTSFTNMTVEGTGPGLDISSAGSVTEDGTMTMGANGTVPTVTNDGILTAGTSGALVFDGSSSLTNGGVLTDDNTAADSIELGAGGFTVTGGTICGTAPTLNSAPLTFSGTPVAGANCTSGNQDQIQVRTGTTALTGNVPVGYTIVANATISTAAAVTNNGEIQLAGGTLLVGSTTTLTNNGTFDVTAANATIDASSTSIAGALTTTSTGSFTLEGELTLSSNSSDLALTNDGTMTLSSAGTLNFEGNSSLTNGGVLTDNNTNANSISLSAGGLTVTGGTICGTAPSLNTAPLTFSGTPVAGANCTSGNQDQIQVRTGTTALSGNVPTGYTIIANASISTAAAVTNNGEIQLAGGTLIVGGGTTLTNNGTFDVTALNATIDASSTNTAASHHHLEWFVHPRR